MLSLLLAQATDLTDPFSTTATDAATAAAGTAAVGVFTGVMIFVWILGILGFIIWVWALIDVIRRQFTNQNDKILWLVITIVLGTLGAIIYLIAGRGKGTVPAKTA